jgi:methylase of polypeptide subunit release factors
MRRARKGIEFDWLGGPLKILPHVYVPADRSVPAMFLAYAHLFKGRLVLDVGTGTGVVALTAAALGAARVVATDVSARAVDCARLNVERLGLAGTVEVRPPGDLFDPVAGESFDVITFNAPWVDAEPQTPYERALCDPGALVLRAFLAGARARLAPGGRMLLQHADVPKDSDETPRRLAEALREGGFAVAGRRSIRRRSRATGSRERVTLYELAPT